MTETSLLVAQPIERWRRLAYVGVAILLAVALAKLGGQLQKRVVFPWDILTCFESPHLAAVAKLRNGEPLYGPAADANSEPYPPATAWLTCGVLQPFGRELDIRYARGIAVGTTILTAFVATWIVCRTLLTAGTPSRTVRRLAPLVAGAAFLLLHRCLTSDQPHPDNLHILHAAVLLLICLRGNEPDESWPWILAFVWASLGVLTKQTAMFAPISVLIMQFGVGINHRHRETTMAVLGLFGLGLMFWLKRDPAQEFHLFTALGSHAIDWSRLTLLVTDPTPTRAFPRVLIAVIGLFALRHFRRDSALHPFYFCWSAIGFFEVLPAIAGFIKIGGNYNNLGVIDFWLFLLTAPYLLLLAMSDVRRTAIGATAVCCWFAAAIWPMKLTPNEHAYRLGNEVQRRVDADLAAGRTVWLPAGLAFRFRAGDTSTPRDLGIAIWTLEASAHDNRSAAAGIALRDGIEHRLADGAYDRVYDMFPWVLKIDSTLMTIYDEIEIIKGAGYSTHQEYRGIQPLANRCKAYEFKRKD